MGILTRLFGANGQGGRRPGGSWVRDVEPIVLRLVSLGFSMGSAHAIRWFFSPLDGADTFQSSISWVVSIGFGVLGYFVSRGLAHRLMMKEKIWAYAPICFVVEVVEIFCNYALAASMIANATWLDKVPETQRAILTIMTYVVLSAIPLVSLLLAVVDMDLDRKRHGVQGNGGYGWQGGGSYPMKGSPWGGGAQQQPPYQGGYGGQNQRQPRGGQNANPMPQVAGVP